VYNTLAGKHKRNTKFEIHKFKTNNKTYFRKTYDKFWSEFNWGFIGPNGGTFMKTVRKL
jgi:hypothetical protein